MSNNELLMNTEPQNNDNGFIKSLSEYFARFISRFKGSTAEDLNAAIVEEGRTAEEKEQLLEMCEEVDNYHRRLQELRESGLSPGKWLEKEIDAELENIEPGISSESKTEFKKFIFEQFATDIEANTEALSEELDQTVDIAKGGQK